MKFGHVRSYFHALLNDYTDPRHEDPTRSRAYGIVPVLRSAPGLGKTSLYRQVMEEFQTKLLTDETRSAYLAQWAGENGQTWGTQVIEPAQMDVPDARGYLTLRKYNRPDGSVAHVSEYSHPPVVEAPGMPRVGGRWIDEIGQCEHDMQKALASLLLEGRIGDFRTGWLRWGATNRTTDSSGVKKMLAHFRNRVKVIELEPQVEELVGFCAKLGFPPLAFGFIPFRPGVIFNDDVPRDDDPFCTPRSFVAGVMELMMLSGGVDKPLRLDEDAREHVSGWIGKAASAEFFAYMEVAHKVATIEQILADPERVKVPTEISMRFALMGVVIHHVDDQNVATLLKFLSRLPQEMQVSIMHAFHTKARKGLFKAKAFAEWVRDNQDIVLAVQALGSAR